MCRPGEGLQFACECATGFTGDGRYCHGNNLHQDLKSDTRDVLLNMTHVGVLSADIDECRETRAVCGPNTVCINQPGTFRCECASGFVVASDGRTCIGTFPSVCVVTAVLVDRLCRSYATLFEESLVSHTDDGFI